MPLFETLNALLWLTGMEIILGIDNVVFIAILVSRLPREQQARARRLGLLFALVTRVLLLLTLTYILSLKDYVVFSLEGLGFVADLFARPEVLRFTIRDLVLLAGGLFLIAKSTYEIHHKLEGEGDETQAAPQRAGYLSTIIQIGLIDIVFSLDSVITAIAMARDIWVMVTAVVLAIGVMLVFAGPIGTFVHRHPTIKILALSFLILIGVMLTADAFDQHIERGYIYSAMGFSLVVELLNLRLQGKSKPVQLKEPTPPAE